MTINNHFYLPMNTRNILDRELSAQDFSEEQPLTDWLESYRNITRNYARMENAIAVLSDMHSKKSHIYYGGFSKMLGIAGNPEEVTLSSIWEEEIFKLIHPDDLTDKHLQELCFFNFVRRQPTCKRTDYYLSSKLRMKQGCDSYIPVLHRMFYISAPNSSALRLAICLYSPLLHDMPAKCVIVDSTNGQISELGGNDRSKILSAREKQILNLINKGMTSKNIAETLSISTNTVNRHRQNILAALQVKNSIEACRIAKDFNLM